MSSAERTSWPSGRVRTAFVIPGGSVLTAWHCVRDLRDLNGDVWLLLHQGVDGGPRVEIPVVIEQYVLELDCAVFRLDDRRLDESSFPGGVEEVVELLERVALPLGLEVHPHDRVRVAGFPELNPATSCVMLAGTVTSPSALVGAAPALRLQIRELAARFPESPGGLSGGPVLRRLPDGTEQVVGVVYAYPPSTDGAAALGGELLARRIAELQHAFPVLHTALSASQAAPAAGWISGRLHEAGVLSGHKDWVRGVAVSPDGRYVASSGDDRLIRVWDVADRACVQILEGHSDTAWRVAFAPSGSTLASASYDGTVQLWDTRSWRSRAILRGHRGWVLGLAFDPRGGWLASVGGDGCLRLWDSAPLKDLGEIEVSGRGSLRAVAFDRFGDLLAAGGDDGCLRVWNARDRRLLHTVDLLGIDVLAVDLNSTGRLLATGGSDAWLAVHDTVTGQLLRRLHGHSGDVQAVCFGITGDALASGGRDGTVRIWEDGATDRGLVIGRHGDPVESLAFSPRSGLLVTGGRDRQVRLWS